MMVAILMSGACAPEPEGAGSGVAVVAGFYPLAEAAERLGNGCAIVSNLTPPGVEPHDLELAPDDVARVVSADVVVTLGSLQPALEGAAGQARGRVVDVSEMAASSGAAPDAASDPHVWLDPGAWAGVIPQIAEQMAGVLPSDCDVIANADAYVGRLTELDQEFAAGLSDCDRTVIVTGHAAFGHLAAAYGLTQEALAGLDPAAEPSAERVAQLRDLVERQGVTTIFAEELVPADLARTLADEAGVAVATLDPLEGLTDDKIAAGADYFSVMRANLETLRGALGCR